MEGEKNGHDFKLESVRFERMLYEGGETILLSGRHKEDGSLYVFLAYEMAKEQSKWLAANVMHQVLIDVITGTQPVYSLFHRAKGLFEAEIRYGGEKAVSYETSCIELGYIDKLQWLDEKEILHAPYHLYEYAAMLKLGQRRHGR